MSKVNLYLKNAPSKVLLSKLKRERSKECAQKLHQRYPVIMSIAFYGKRELIATGKFVSLKFWDREMQRVKNLLETPKETREDGEWLDDKKRAVEKFIRNAHEENQNVSKHDLHEIITGKVKVRTDKTDLKEILDFFLTQHSTRAGASLRPNTKKKFVTLIRHMRDFQGHNQFNIQVYDTQWVKDFKVYLSVTVGLQDNSICKYLKALKSFFNVLSKSGYRIKARFEDIRISEKPQEVFALKIEELLKLEEAQFQDELLSMVKDIFLFQCYVGSRYSDIEVIKWDDIKEESNGSMSWSYISVKTNDSIIAPLNEKAIAILEKYKHLPHPLPRISNQVMNAKIKLVAKDAGLDRTVKRVEYRDNQINEVYIRLHDALTTHIARKSFISIMLQLGVDERLVRAISGHKDERSFKRYIDLDRTPFNAIDEAWKKLFRKP